MTHITRGIQVKYNSVRDNNYSRQCLSQSELSFLSLPKEIIQTHTETRVKERLSDSFQPRILYLDKLSIQSEGKIKTF